MEWEWPSLEASAWLWEGHQAPGLAVAWPRDLSGRTRLYSCDNCADCRVFRSSSRHRQKHRIVGEYRGRTGTVKGYRPRQKRWEITGTKMKMQNTCWILHANIHTKYEHKPCRNLSQHNMLPNNPFQIVLENPSVFSLLDEDQSTPAGSTYTREWSQNVLTCEVNFIIFMQLVKWKHGIEIHTPSTATGKLVLEDFWLQVVPSTKFVSTPTKHMSARNIFFVFFALHVCTVDLKYNDYEIEVVVFLSAFTLITSPGQTTPLTGQARNS